jgi:hypothetical protein
MARTIARDRTVTDARTKGPATYGRPVSEWQALVRAAYPARHMDLVAMLKREHGMGHGHANAVVAQTLAEDRD